MNSSLKRFAPLGLYLSIVAAIAAAGLYVVQREFTLPLQIALGLIVAGLAIFAIFDPQRVRLALTGRQAKYGSNTLVMFIAFLGILVVINYLVYKNPKRWDLTEDNERTLAKETIEILQNLAEPVTATGFFTQSLPVDTTRNLLEDFKYNSNGNFDYRFINPDEDPVTAQQAGVTQDGTVVLQMAGRQEKLDYSSEQELVTAMIRLSNPGERVVYFLTGHGEYNPEGTGESSYGEAGQALKDKNYTVKTLNLLAAPQIPEDAQALVVAGPRKPLSDNEVELIRGYLDNGGALIAMVEPGIVTDFGEAPDPLGAYLAETWGVTLDDDLVIDPSINPPSVAVAGEYGAHAITNELQTNLMATLFPTARTLEVSADSGFNPVVLVKTANSAWGETDMAALQNNEAKMDEGADVAGPVSLAAAVEDSAKKTRVVVIGDADFAANGSFAAYGNGDLFTNTVDWAAQQENLINLTPKKTTQRFMAPPGQTTLGLIFLGSVFVLPGLILGAGIITWIQRRRRG